MAIPFFLTCLKDIGLAYNRDPNMRAYAAHRNDLQRTFRQPTTAAHKIKEEEEEEDMRTKI